jgi:hypothetical protein
MAFLSSCFHPQIGSYSMRLDDDIQLFTAELGPEALRQEPLDETPKSEPTRNITYSQSVVVGATWVYRD